MENDENTCTPWPGLLLVVFGERCHPSFHVRVLLTRSNRPYSPRQTQLLLVCIVTLALRKLINRIVQSLTFKGNHQRQEIALEKNRFVFFPFLLNCSTFFKGKN